MLPQKLGRIDVLPKAKKTERSKTLIGIVRHFGLFKFPVIKHNIYEQMHILSDFTTILYILITFVITFGTLKKHL